MAARPVCFICEDENQFALVQKSGRWVCDACLEDSEYYHEGHLRGGCYWCKMD